MGVGNYTEQDVKEIARALTGWQLRYSTTDLYPVEVGQFLFSSGNHDFGTKRVLGQSFTPQDASQLDKGDYKLVHNIIFNQRKMRSQNSYVQNCIDSTCMNFLQLK